jgi:hypothetical protein
MEWAVDDKVINSPFHKNADERLKVAKSQSNKESQTAAAPLGGRDAARSCQNKHEQAIRPSDENGGHSAVEQQ